MLSDCCLYRHVDWVGKKGALGGVIEAFIMHKILFYEIPGRQGLEQLRTSLESSRQGSTLTAPGGFTGDLRI